jgi:REP element-mobilizing transposase RayT
VLLYAIKKAQDKYRFKLYALCIMSNHVHYLMEPAQVESLRVAFDTKLEVIAFWSIPLL